MKQTAVEWLISKIEVNSNPSLTQKEMIGYIEQAKEMEKQQQDKFAIEFGKWLENLTEDFYSKNDECSYSELLEIFKNK
jgi:hypothetical protein